MSEQKNSDLSNVRRVMVFLLSWFLGFKWIIAFYQTYLTYNYPSRNNLMASFFMLTWIWYGFFSALAQLFMTMAYVMMYHKDTVLDLYKMLSESVTKIQNKPDSELTDEDRSLLSYYNSVVTVKTLAFNKLDVFRKIVETNNVVIKVVGLYKTLSSYTQNINSRYYLELANNYLSIIVAKVWELLMKIPYFNSWYESAKNLSQNELIRLQVNEEEAKKQEEMKKKMEEDLNNLESMMSKITPQNLPPLPNFGDQYLSKMPNEQDLKQFGDMVKMLGDMEKFIDKFEPPKSLEQKKNE